MPLGIQPRRLFLLATEDRPQGAGDFEQQQRSRSGRTVRLLFPKSRFLTPGPSQQTVSRDQIERVLSFTKEAVAFYRL
jgi:hypothetical protein